jgi:hypothetical protein
MNAYPRVDPSQAHTACLRRLLLSIAIVAVTIALAFATSVAHAVQGCAANIDQATPDVDLIDNADATVTHSTTGLMWKQCSEGMSGAGCATGTASALTWANAQAAATTANGANFANHNDWRLPNLNELQSIVETACHDPSINLTRFPKTTVNAYWSSTDYQFSPTFVWGANFSVGQAMLDAKTATHNVRLVRGGKAFNEFDSTVPGSTSASGASSTGTGTISASFTGGGAGCGFGNSQFVAPEAPPPYGVTLPHGLFDFTAYNCTAASSLAFTITYPTTLPANTVYWKYGATAGNATPHWYILPATIAGTQVQFTIVDGQLGDDDATANGRITDPGGPGSDHIFGNGFDGA